MGKIINFCEARQKLELSGLVSALKWRQSREKPPKEPEKPYTGSTKRPLIVSALPGETIPPEFPDFRPFLQRDGLILLGWSRWDISPHYMRESPCYTVNWITSAPNRHHRRYKSDCITEAEMGTTKPDVTGDPYFLQGIRGKPFDFKYAKDEDVADYVFTCAPWDLNRRTIPGFIAELKAAGITVNFDFPYSMDYVKKLEFAAALQAAPSGSIIEPPPCAWGKAGL